MYVVFLTAEGLVLSQQKHSYLSGGVLQNVYATDSASVGQDIAGPGDINQDGVPDILVSAHLDSTANTEAGSFWLIFLANNGTALSCTFITEANGGFTGYLGSETQWGSALSSVLDVNSDGINDALVATPKQDAPGVPDYGRVFVLFLTTEGTVSSHTRFGAGESGFTGQSVNYFGSAVSGTGDLNGTLYN